MYCRWPVLPVVVFAVTAAVQGAERPTAIEVRDAVERSRAEYRELHPPVSKAQAQRKVEEDVQRARAKLGQARKIRNPQQRAAALKKANDEIAALGQQIDREDYPEDRDRLIPLKMAVSRNCGAAEKISQHRLRRVVRCVASDKTEMLAVIEHQPLPVTRVRCRSPSPRRSC
jgi:hypothetical protein